MERGGNFLLFWMGFLSGMPGLYSTKKPNKSAKAHKTFMVFYPQKSISRYQISASYQKFFLSLKTSNFSLRFREPRSIGFSPPCLLASNREKLLRIPLLGNSERTMYELASTHYLLPYRFFSDPGACVSTLLLAPRSSTARHNKNRQMRRGRREAGIPTW